MEEVTAGKKPALHASMLSMLADCPKRVEFRYIKGMRRPPGVAQVTGTATHRAAEFSLGNKLAGIALPSPEEVRAVAADALDRAWDAEGVALNAEERTVGEAGLKGAAKDDAVRLSVCHLTDLAPEIEPVALERKVRLELPGSPFDLEGTWDVQTRTEIRDLKTAAKSPSGGEAAGDPQLELYALMQSHADPKPVTHVALDFLVKTKTAKVVTERALAPANYTALLDRVEQAVKVLESGAFYYASPKSWACSERFCGYWDICPQGRARKVQI